MYIIILILLLFHTDISAWLLPQGSGASVLVGFSSKPRTYLNSHHHSYLSQPSRTVVYQPIVFDLSSLYRTNQALTTSTAIDTTTASTFTDAATATANTTAGYVPQFAAYQITAVPPTQADQQNLAEYDHYLAILRDTYGIQLPGELVHAVPVQSEYQLSAYSTTLVPNYEAAENSYASDASEVSAGMSKNAGHDDNHRESISTTITSESQPEYQVFTLPTPIVNPQQQGYEATMPSTPPSPTSDVYSQAIHPESQILQQQQLVPLQRQYPWTSYAATPTTSPSSSSHESAAHLSYTVEPPTQHSQQTARNPVQQILPDIHQSTQSPFRPQLSVTAGITKSQEMAPLSYQNAALLVHQAQSTKPKPQVYTYGDTSQSTNPTYSSIIPSGVGFDEKQKAEFDSHKIAEPMEEQGTYGGWAENKHEEVFATYITTTPSYWLSSVTTTTTATRPQPPSSTITSNTLSPSNTNKSQQETVVSVKSLVQQIRRLPAVLYVNSQAKGREELEILLRDTYGLPLVVFYVDKLEQPDLAEKLLFKLTAHKTLPYLFICGTFIGSEEHIQSYHKNHQIPKLVEYVCGEDRMKKKEKTKKTST